MDGTKFENRFVVTKSHIRREYKLTQKRSGKLNIWLLYSMISLFAFDLLANLIVRPQNIYSHIVDLLVICFFLVYSFYILPARKLKAFARLSGEKKPYPPLLRVIRFGESISLQTGNSVLSYSYDKVRFIEDSDECIYFWLNLTMVVTVFKDSFSIGNPDEFVAFLTEKSSEQEPLWSKRELNKRVFKQMIPLVIIEIFIFMLFLSLLLGKL